MEWKIEDKDWVKEKKEYAFKTILNKLMLKRNITQTEFCRHLKMSTSTFHDWTVGTIPHDNGLVHLIAQMMEVSYEYLCFGEETDQDEMRRRLRKLELENALLKIERDRLLTSFGHDGLKMKQQRGMSDDVDSFDG